MGDLPYGDAGLQFLPDRVGNQDDSDHDSQDSNREDHEDHDYPDESSHEDGDDVYSDNEELAAERYNKKHQPVVLKNCIIDSIIKKGAPVQEEVYKPLSIPKPLEDEDDDMEMY